MKHFLRSGLLCLFIFSMNVSSQGTEDPWMLSWPLFENTSGPSGVLNGYGDWCVASEGLHPGIDLYSGLAVNLVLNPFDRCPDSSLYAKGFFPREGV